VVVSLRLPIPLVFLEGGGLLFVSPRSGLVEAFVVFATAEGVEVIEADGPGGCGRCSK